MSRAANGDEMVHFSLEHGDVQAQLCRPVVHAVPVDGALGVAEAGKQLRAGRFEAEAVLLRVAAGHVFPPEMVVEVEIQQGAVHVEEDDIDLVAMQGFAAPDEAELERWLESDEPLPPSVSTEDVNEGELVFLARPPAKPVHHHFQRLILDARSRQSGWVRMAQCHENLDPVPATQIVFRPGRIRDLEITQVRGIERAWVEGDTVQLENVGRDARLCLRGLSRALTPQPDGGWALVTVVIEYGEARLRPVRIRPPGQPGFTVEQAPGRIRLEAWFEGRLQTEIRFVAADSP